MILLTVVMEGRDRRGWGVLMIMHTVVVRSLTSCRYKAGIEHAGFPPDKARRFQAQRSAICWMSRMREPASYRGRST